MDGWYPFFVVIKEYHKSYKRAIPFIENFQLSRKQEKAFLQSMQDDKHSVFYCAWRNDGLVGTGSISGMPRRMNRRAALGLSVVKAEWNNGIGSILMEKLIEYARQNGTEIIDFELMYLDLR